MIQQNVSAGIKEGKHKRPTRNPEGSAAVSFFCLTPEGRLFIFPAKIMILTVALAK